MQVKIIGENNYLGNLQEQFFKNRGIENYLDFVNLKGFKETNPFDFKNMELAVNTLLSVSNTRVGIVVDSDIDGISSASELYNALDTYFSYELKVSIHRKKTHGINIEELNDDGILEWADILIVPDAGSEDYSQHKILKDEYGITTIILDHHIAQKYSKHAIVVNNQLSNVSVNLTGSAMVYKFLQALEIKTNEQFADDYLDLVALGLIGDMADTRDLEVQSLIRRGIKQFQNAFLSNIVESDYNIDENRISSTTLAFSVIPMINACTRVAEFEEISRIVEAMCNIGTDRVFEYEPTRGKNKGTVLEENIYQHAYRVAKTCKSRQDSMVKKALEGSKRPLKEGLYDSFSISDINNTENKIIVADITEYAQDSGLSGLIANKIMYKYNKPTLVFMKKDDGSYLGSGRGEQIQFLRTKLEQSKLFKSVQGHEPAFGIRLDKDFDIESLNKMLNDYFKEESTEAQYVADFNVPIDFLEDYMIDELASLEEFFGMGLKAPLIYIENVNVKTSDITTGNNSNLFKFNMNDIEFIKFRMTPEKLEELIDWSECMCYNMICKPSINEYDGKRIVQLIIEDIEVIKNNEYMEDATDEWNTTEEGIEW